MNIEGIINNNLKELIEKRNYLEIEKVMSEIARDTGVINPIHYNFYEKNNEVYTVYTFKDETNTGINKGILNLSSDGLDLIILGLFDSIRLGTTALIELNGSIRKIKGEIDGELNVQYNWGTDKYCSIKDWDYRNIKIKVSKMALDNIIGEYKKNSNLGKLNDILLDTNWGMNIIEFINSFNDIKLHREIYATVNKLDVNELLTENMLNTNDVVELIKKNKNNTGKQRIKSIGLIKELGSFAAVIYWDIDYKNNKIISSIQDEKVLDIENKRFVSDYSIYSRIENRIKLPDDIKNSLFENSNNVKTIGI